jgi:hypothetical protein
MSLLLSPGQPRPATSAELQALETAYGKLQQARTRAIARPWFHVHGIGDPLLIWMIFQDHIKHQNAADQRASSLRFSDQNRFLLTDQGAEFTKLLLAQRGSRGIYTAICLGRLVPHYGQEERIFSWGRHVLKQFRQPAGAQELLLKAAEEQGWPEWMDDPLPCVAGIDPKDHLHDTIGNLNRHLRRSFVHFNGNGTGKRFGWELR